MKTYIGLVLFLFHVYLESTPKASLSSFYGTAPALSILFPKITIGTF
jgi:hypothetical protein